MVDDAVWQLEERLWTGGEEAYRATLDAECVMAFPAPAGVMTGARIAASLAAAPRWASVELRGRQTGRPARHLVVLGYQARALRDGAAPYEAFCTSTWHSVAGRWLIVQHQQTVVGSPDGQPAAASSSSEPRDHPDRGATLTP
jgi:hypothetical protein